MTALLLEQQQDMGGGNRRKYMNKKQTSFPNASFLVAEEGSTGWGREFAAGLKTFPVAANCADSLFCFKQSVKKR